MPIPFSIKYTQPLEGKVDTEDYPQILKQISDFIIAKPAEDIVIENNELKFNPGSSPSRWNLMKLSFSNQIVRNPASNFLQFVSIQITKNNQSSSHASPFYKPNPMPAR